MKEEIQSTIVKISDVRVEIYSNLVLLSVCVIFDMMTRKMLRVSDGYLYQQICHGRRSGGNLPPPLAPSKNVCHLKESNLTFSNN